MRGGFPIKSFYHNMDFGFSNTTRWNISERTVFNYTTNNYYGGGYSSGFGNSCGGGNFWSGFGMGLGNALGNLLGGFSMGFGNFGMGSFGMGGFGFGNWGNSFWGNNTPTTSTTVNKTDADHAKLNELEAEVDAMNKTIDDGNAKEGDYTLLKSRIEAYKDNKDLTTRSAFLDGINDEDDKKQAELLLARLKPFTKASSPKQETTVTPNDNSGNSTKPAEKLYGTLIDKKGYSEGYADYKSEEDKDSIKNNGVIKAHDTSGKTNDVNLSSTIEGKTTVGEINDKGCPNTISITTSKNNKYTYTFVEKTDDNRYIYKSDKTNNYYLLQKKGLEFHLMQYNGMTGYGVKDEPSSK